MHKEELFFCGSYGTFLVYRFDDPTIVEISLGSLHPYVCPSGRPPVMLNGIFRQM